MSQPFNFQHHAPSPGYNGGYGNAYYPAQSPYGQRPGYAPAVHQQHTAPEPPPFPPAPGMNFTRFDGNPQAPPPAQPFPFPAGSFPPEMIKQFASAGIPPPPPPGFPHMQMPNLTFPQFPQPHTASPSSQFYQQPTQIPDDGTDAYDPRFPQHIMQSFKAGASSMLSHNVTPEARKETQEIGSASSHTVSQGEYQPEQHQAYNHPQFPANMDAGASLSVESQLPLLRDTVAHTSVPAQNVVANAPSRQTGNMEPQPASNRTPQPSLSTSKSAPQDLSVGRAPESTAQQDYASRPLPELRGLAKSALVAFAPHGIQFDDLVKEGIHPEILKQLYGELGMQSGSSPRPAASAEIASNDLSKPPFQIRSPTDSVAAATSAASPSLERKDRIAQLLAAKAGRPSPVRSTSESKPAATTNNLSSSTQVPTNVVSDAAKQPATLVQGRAQAELVRQKMEQSRKDASPQQPTTITAPLQISLPPSGALTNAMSSPFTSGIPGLAMMSADEEDSFPGRPAKRPLDAEVEMTIESGHKRQNTGISSKTDGEAMEIDADSSSDASEGEVIESPAPVKDLSYQRGAPDTRAPVQPQKNPFTSSTIARLTPAQMAEKAEMLKAKFLKQRARQKALQDGLPSLDAEVSRTEHVLSEQRAQLEQTKKRVALLEANLAKARQDEQNQLSQIQRFEEQLREGLSGREKYTEELQNLTNEQTSINRSATNSEPPALATTSDDAAIASGQAEVLEHANSQAVEPVNPAEVVVGKDAGESGSVEATFIEQVATDQSAASSRGNISEDGETFEGSAGSEASPAEEDEYAPNQQLTEGSRIDTEVGESDGSASMSDSASEIDQADQEEDDYEPPDDPTQPMDIDDDSSVDYEPADTPIDLPVNHDDLEEGEEVEDSFSQEPVIEAPTTEPSVTGAQSVVEHGLDLIEQQGALADSEPMRMHDVQEPSRSSAPATPNFRWGRGRPSIRPLSNDGNNKSNSFSAYQSPLTSFPAYRHNERFDENAKDGYRSLTYSNRIDPRVPLCPTELAGEVCQDPQCEEQHFRHLGLTDDKILAQMSSASEFKDKEVRDRYLLGLKDTIADLRAKAIKDFEDVAKALAKYRRDFLTEQ